jgi:hypothetical protein
MYTIKTINYDDKYSKYLLDREYVLDYLELLENKPSSKKLFEMADWCRRFFDMTEHLDLVYTKEKTINENIVDIIFQLKISYIRLKRLCVEYYYEDIFDTIKYFEKRYKFTGEETGTYNNSSGYRNIFKKGDKWRVSLYINKKQKSFGDFKTIGEALERRNIVWRDLKICS